MRAPTAFLLFVSMSMVACGAQPRLASSASSPPSSSSPSSSAPASSFDQAVHSKTRVLWVAAHPDDEGLGGGALSRACIRNGSTCHFLVFTRGDGGECGIEGGCHPNLGAVRTAEMVRAARDYHATLEMYGFFNAPLPVESFPTREELEHRWMSEGDPVGLVARAIRRFRPDFVFTLDPYHGFTGHPEHQAAARITIAGVRVAANATTTIPMVASEPPHRVQGIYHVLNEYWIMDLVGLANDPPPIHETLDNTDTCTRDSDGSERSCLDVFLGSTRVHRSQRNDMGNLRLGKGYLETTYLRRFDPFGEEAKKLVAELEQQAPVRAEEK